MVLGLSLKAKRIEGDVIWTWTVLEVIIARLDVITKPGLDIIDLEREKALETSDILLLELEKDIDKRKEALLFFL